MAATRDITAEVLREVPLFSTLSEDELARGEAMVRDLSTGEQRTRPIETIPERLKEA